MADSATASPSSSSSSAATKKYDVFISFRGEDTRKSFTSHLHAALCQNKIETYIDYRLHKGDEVWPALVRAIQDSNVFVVIFSENYASSTWCLNELTQIIECKEKGKGQVLIPVFYKTSPSHVRKQTGSYGQAFAEHEEDNNRREKVAIWKAALTKAADLAGYDSHNYGTEAILVEEIVKCVLLKLKSIHMFRSYLKGLVGIQEQIAHVESLLDNGSTAVYILGIWGMGGIGKTTIAEAVYRGLRSKYEGCYFLHNVREKWEKGGVDKLQKELVIALLQENESHISNPIVGSDYDIRRLGRKKLLVILDDVNDSEQLEYLCGGHDWLGQGSRIIVTARDKDVLKEADDVYEVMALNSNEALQLFSLNAFKKNHPEMEYTHLSMRFVDYAKGIPLALKVLGSLLYRKEKEVWESELKKLEKMPHKRIHNILKLSYFGLDRDEQKIFLYIVCCLKGETKARIRILLDACGCSTISGLKNLEDKALITIPDGCVLMHDLIQEMGLEVVREESTNDPGQRSHLWDPNDIFQVLKNCTGTAAIESITLDISRIEKLHLSPQAFANMRNLKFLEFYSSLISQCFLFLPGGLDSLSSEELRIFSWSGYPSKSLPSTFCARNMVELRLQNSLVEKLWEGVQNLVNLREINLRGSENLIELPDFSLASNLSIVDLSYCISLIELPDFSNASNLEVVDLSCCTSLTCVHPSILSLRKLQRLELSGCEMLTSLQSDNHLRCLTHLSLHFCSSLKEFSVMSEKMTHLNLAGTAISELPSSIAHLHKLENLRLDGNGNLKNLPKEFSYLSSLKKLDISDCGQLETSNLHIQLGGLQSLRYLKLNYSCDGLPESIGRLSSLDSLSLDGTTIETLPASIKHLSQLTYLSLRNCERLQTLPELPPSLQMLWAEECRSLRTVMSSMADLMKEHKRLTPSLSQTEDYALGFSFLNCINLDAQACNAIIEDAWFRINRVVYEHLSRIEADEHGNYVINVDSALKAFVWFPGSIAPHWFSYQTMLPLLAIELPPDWELFGFVFCFTVRQLPPVGPRSLYVKCHYQIEPSNGDGVKNHHKFYCVGSWDTAHVYIWYDVKFGLEIMNILKRSRATHQCNTKVTFEFSFTDHTGINVANCEFYQCGVCPINASEYDNFLKQMELKLKLSYKTNKVWDVGEIVIEAGSSNEIGIGVEGSDHEEDEQGTLLLDKESEGTSVPIGTQSQNKIRDSSEKSSCDCFIGLLLKHLWRLISM